MIGMNKYERDEYITTYKHNKMGVFFRFPIEIYPLLVLIYNNHHFVFGLNEW